MQQNSRYMLLRMQMLEAAVRVDYSCQSELQGCVLSL
jgi:hypothetical protein